MKFLKLLQVACLLAILPVSTAWSAAVFQSAGSLGFDSDPRSISGALSVPNATGLAINDDAILVAAYADGVNSAWTTPSGWTPLCTAAINTGTQVSVYARKADSTLVAAGSVSVVGGASGNSVGAMLRYTGLNSTPTATCAAQYNSSAVQDIATPARTVSTDNQLIIHLGVGMNSAVSSGASCPASGTSRAMLGNDFATGTDLGLAFCEIVQTTQTNIASGSINLTATNTMRSFGLVITMLSEPLAPPVFSGTIPAQSFVEDSAITPLDLSSYWTLESSCAIQSGTLPAGLSFNTSTVTISGTPTTPAGAVAIVIRCTNTDGTADSNSFNITITSAASPSLSAVSVTTRSTTQFTVSYTSGGGSGTTWIVVCPTEMTAPSDSELRAGQCAGGGTALDADSETSNGSNSIIVDCPRPACGVYALHRISTTSSAITSLLRELTTPPAGRQYTILESIAAGSWVADWNAAYSPDLAVGDILSTATNTTPSSYVWNQLSNGNGCYPWTGTICAGGNSNRQIVLMDVYDVSAADYISGGPHSLVFNNQAPVCAAPLLVPLLINQVATVPSECTDPEGDSITYGVSAGTESTGLTTNTGTGATTGTPTVEDEVGNTVTYSATDAYGGSLTFLRTYYILNTITIPCTHGVTDAVSCSSLIQTNWLNVTGTFRCSATVPSGTVVTLSPASGQEAAPYTMIAMQIANGPCTRQIPINQ